MCDTGSPVPDGKATLVVVILENEVFCSADTTKKSLYLRNGSNCGGHGGGLHQFAE